MANKEIKVRDITALLNKITLLHFKEDDNALCTMFSESKALKHFENRVVEEMGVDAGGKITMHLRPESEGGVTCLSVENVTKR